MKLTFKMALPLVALTLLLSSVSGAVQALEFGFVDPSAHGYRYATGDSRESYVTTFSQQTRDIVLSVDGFDIDEAGEVRVYLNDEPLGSLQITPNNEHKRSAMFIAKSRQLTTNRLEFRQARPGWKWGIRNLLLHDVDAQDVHLRKGRPNTTAYGFFFGDRIRYGGLAVRFVATADRDYELTVKGYNITHVSSVKATINGRILGFLPLGRPKRETAARTFVIPAEWQKQGTNRVVFSLRDPGTRWGIVSLALNERRTTSVTVVSPGQNLAAIVAASSPDTRFIIRRGRYRTQQISPKPGQHFDCEPGTIISGAVVLTGSWRSSGGRWYLDGAPRALPGNGVMTRGREINRIRNDVFVDGRLYLRVDSLAKVTNTPRDLGGQQVYAGTFFQDGGRVWLPTDPRRSLVEMSIERWAFFATAGGADGVTIDDCTIEKFTPEDLEGAIEAKYTARWLLRNLQVRHNHTGGLRVGRETTVVGGRYNHNGQMGITGSLVGEGGARFGFSDTATVSGTQIAYNNWAEYDSAWHGGGVKFYRTRGVVLTDNRVHHNFGPGLWVDWDVYNTHISANNIFSNGGNGIAIEAAFFGEVHNNLLRCNSTMARHSQNRNWFWGAQILSKNSPGFLIHSNALVVNGGQGMGIGDNLDRGSNPIYGKRKTVDNLIYNNTVYFTNRPRSGATDGQSGIESDNAALQSGLDATAASAANRFFDNVYHYADPGYAHWRVGTATYTAGNLPANQEQGTEFRQRNAATLSPQTLCP